MRRRFERAAATYAKSSRLEGEVATRMLERLDYVKLAPRRVLDAGSGPPRQELARRYPKAQVVALDFALPMLRAVRRGWFRKHSILLCSDIGRMPLAAGSFELVWCNMALHWLEEPLPAFREFSRVLAPEGLLVFSTLGPDTLKELRAAAGAERVHQFIDMHDLGDMLVGAGFASPVMDMEMIQVDYGRGDGLVADLRSSGQTSARADRRRGLGGRAMRARLRAALPPRVTFEVVYGHAWKGRKVPPEVKSVRVFKRMP
ncbi:MAG TPA: methyltransferase domain-containing protein [Burkholderiales bacterium]|nr:methyltransferase domain-containing protein [Burkholderiales bacterium]